MNFPEDTLLHRTIPILHLNKDSVLLTLKCDKILDEADDMVTGLLTNFGSTPGKTRNYFLPNVQTGSGAHIASESFGTKGPSPGGKSGRSLKLTTNLHLEPRLKMHGSLTSTPLDAFS